jgi:hypothetical protein
MGALTLNAWAQKRLEAEASRPESFCNLRLIIYTRIQPRYCGLLESSKFLSSALMESISSCTA